MLLMVGLSFLGVKAHLFGCWLSITHIKPTISANQRHNVLVWVFVWVFEQGNNKFVK